MANTRTECWWLVCGLALLVQEIEISNKLVPHSPKQDWRCDRGGQCVLAAEGHIGLHPVLLQRASPTLRPISMKVFGFIRAFRRALDMPGPADWLSMEPLRFRSPCCWQHIFANFVPCSNAVALLFSILMRHPTSRCIKLASPIALHPCISRRDLPVLPCARHEIRTFSLPTAH